MKHSYKLVQARLRNTKASGGKRRTTLLLLLDELELQVVHFEDRTEDLKAFAAQAILDCGSIENYFAEHGNCLPDCKLPPDVGYFLLIAEKRNA